MTAIYAGSFDPFTNGHLDIIREASQMFDRLVIVVSDNTKKTRFYDADETVNLIRSLLYRYTIINDGVTVIRGDKLITDIATDYGARYLVRGLRNTSDYIYEEEIAKFNSLQNPNLRTVYIRAANDISSSTVRELLKYGKDVSKLVPPDIFYNQIQKGERS